MSKSIYTKTQFTNLIELHKVASKELDGEFIITKLPSVTNKITKLYSCCIFRIPDPYKDESQYYNGIILTVENLVKSEKSSIIVIYYDDTIFNKNKSEKWIDAFNKLLRLPNTCLVKYNFPQFENIVNGVRYHNSLFGTIMRSVPLFDFVKLPYIIIMIDIDKPSNKQAKNYFVRLREELDLINKYNAKIFFYGYACTDCNMSSDRLINDTEYPLNSLMNCISKIQFPKKYLKNFLKCVENKCELWKKFPNHKKDELFTYGMDEWFFNTSLLLILKEIKVKILISTALRGIDFHYSFYIKTNNYKTITTKQKIILQKMYKSILKDKFTNDLVKNFEITDKLVYKLDGSHANHDTIKNTEINNILYNTFSDNSNVLLNNNDFVITKCMKFIGKMNCKSIILLLINFASGKPTIEMRKCTAYY